MAEVDRIATLSDSVLRNLQITQCYHELSLALAKRTGPYANWCTFVTWASKQAGQTIRKEDLARALEHILTATPTTMQAAANVATIAQQIGARRDPEAIRQRVWEALNPIAAIDRASAAVARGNQKVFAELEQIDPTPDSLRETGAVDWADLPDRLHFIVDLFRCYEEAPDLLEPPFTPDQVTEVKAGRLPGGPL